MITTLHERTDPASETRDRDSRTIATQVIDMLGEWMSQSNPAEEEEFAALVRLENDRVNLREPDEAGR